MAIEIRRVDNGGRVVKLERLEGVRIPVLVDSLDGSDLRGRLRADVHGAGRCFQAAENIDEQQKTLYERSAVLDLFGR